MEEMTLDELEKLSSPKRPMLIKILDFLNKSNIEKRLDRCDIIVRTIMMIIQIGFIGLMAYARIQDNYFAWAICCSAFMLSWILTLYNGSIFQHLIFPVESVSMKGMKESILNIIFETFFVKDSLIHAESYINDFMANFMQMHTQLSKHLSMKSYKEFNKFLKEHLNVEMDEVLLFRKHTINDYEKYKQIHQHLVTIVLHELTQACVAFKTDDPTFSLEAQAWNQFFKDKKHLIKEFWCNLETYMSKYYNLYKIPSIYEDRFYRRRITDPDLEEKTVSKSKLAKKPEDDFKWISDL